jgi:hypothetical protein
VTAANVTTCPRVAPHGPGYRCAAMGALVNLSAIEAHAALLGYVIDNKNAGYNFGNNPIPNVCTGNTKRSGKQRRLWRRRKAAGHYPRHRTLLLSNPRNPPKRRASATRRASEDGFIGGDRYKTVTNLRLTRTIRDRKLTAAEDWRRTVQLSLFCTPQVHRPAAQTRVTGGSSTRALQAIVNARLFLARRSRCAYVSLRSASRIDLRPGSG